LPLLCSAHLLLAAEAPLPGLIRSLLPPLPLLQNLPHSRRK